MISSLADLPVAVAEVLLVFAVGELLRVVAVGEVVLGESWLFIFVTHNLEVLFFPDSLGFKFWQLPDFGNFGNLALICAHLFLSAKSAVRFT